MEHGNDVNHFVLHGQMLQKKPSAAQWHCMRPRDPWWSCRKSGHGPVGTWHTWPVISWAWQN